MPLSAPSQSEFWTSDVDVVTNRSISQHCEKTRFLLISARLRNLDSALQPRSPSPPSNARAMRTSHLSLWSIPTWVSLCFSLRHRLPNSASFYIRSGIKMKKSTVDPWTYTAPTEPIPQVGLANCKIAVPTWPTPPVSQGPLHGFLRWTRCTTSSPRVFQCSAMLRAHSMHPSWLLISSLRIIHPGGNVSRCD